MRCGAYPATLQGLMVASDRSFGPIAPAGITNITSPANLLPAHGARRCLCRSWRAVEPDRNEV